MSPDTGAAATPLPMSFQARSAFLVTVPPASRFGLAAISAAEIETSIAFLSFITMVSSVPRDGQHPQASREAAAGLCPGGLNSCPIVQANDASGASMQAAVQRLGAEG